MKKVIKKTVVKKAQIGRTIQGPLDKRTTDILTPTPASTVEANRRKAGLPPRIVAGPDTSSKLGPSPFMGEALKFRQNADKIARAKRYQEDVNSREMEIREPLLRTPGLYKNGGKVKKAQVGTNVSPKGAPLQNLPSGVGVKPIMKSGGKVKKGGMAAFEKTSFDKKADKPGGTHGKEGSAKDKKMDKIDAKKMGFIKGKKK